MHPAEQPGYKSNRANLTPERLPFVYKIQGDLMRRFAEKAEDKNDAMLLWADTYSGPFRILLDADPDLLVRYQNILTRDATLEEIERRLAY